MKDNSRFMHLRELSSELNRKLELLLTGSLPVSELEKLTEESRELYERLVVLRFKAYDEEVKGVSPEISLPEEPAREEIIFRIEEPKLEVPVQVSLIDAIEEVTKAESIQPEFETNVSIESIDIEQEPVRIDITPDVAVAVAANATLQNRESLYEKLSKSIGTSESLNEKLEHNPITDLKRAITLNQRFQFSRELFKGNNQDYEMAIDKLNTTTREDALNHLDSLRKKYEWSPESPVATDFAGLVARRHQ